MSIPIDNPEEVAVCAALKMINAVRGMKKNLNVRVGVASGPLIGILFPFYYFEYPLTLSFSQLVSLES